MGMRTVSSSILPDGFRQMDTNLLSTSAKPSLRDLNTVTYILITVFLNSTLKYLVFSGGNG